MKDQKWVDLCGNCANINMCESYCYGSMYRRSTVKYLRFKFSVWLQHQIDKVFAIR
jgi:hypothetical protein|uniref:Uncharacterized protein n=1 Tax=Myoviridae sp. ctgXL3 TaxID=2826681 RepID=A0A8S5QRY7_9CAUD|nr:MAG TPA: hypothetical protein [Myoviridae sp. ctgXL3]